jgi:alpha-L-fucosidase
MKYEPTFESVSTHAVPDWYNDAKFGIFFHWGLFSVPAYAKKGNNLNDMSAQDSSMEESMKESPYAEWYMNKLRIEGSSTQAYHAEKYGKDFQYTDFQEQFEKINENCDMKQWAEVCKNAGAKYVVLVTKHHDGYCLWPSDIKNPGDPNYQSKRDFVGELTDAVRAEGMKMGLYYSGIFDWSFVKYPIRDIKTFIEHHLSTKEYCDYSVAQTMELIKRYHPSILWNDIGFPYQYDTNKLFADYYNEVEDGVINDRWKQYRIEEGEDREAKLEQWTEEVLERTAREGLEGMMANDLHHDFCTPEYATHFEYREEKWELTRGIGMSFAYNAQEGEEDMLSYPEMVTTLVDVVSKNGNFLLNIGPEADGTIPEMQKKPLMQLGEWLKRNGEAIYGTRCWKVQEGTTGDGKEVRYTEKPDALYVSVLSADLPEKVVIKDLEIPAGSSVELLGNKAKLTWSQDGKDLCIHAAGCPDEPVHVFKISGK